MLRAIKRGSKQSEEDIGEMLVPRHEAKERIASQDGMNQSNGKQTYEVIADAKHTHAI